MTGGGWVGCSWVLVVGFINSSDSPFEEEEDEEEEEDDVDGGVDALAVDLSPSFFSTLKAMKLNSITKNEIITGSDNMPLSAILGL